MRLLAGRTRGQAGQVLVITALLMTAMAGAIALAIDGGRVYIDRRQAQNAADAAALAMADSYYGATQAKSGTPFGTAFAAGAAEFAAGVGLATPTPDNSVPGSCSVVPTGGTGGNYPPAGAPGSGNVVSYRLSGNGLSYTLLLSTWKASNEPQPLCAFNAVVVQNNVQTAFIRLLGIPSLAVGAQATAASAHKYTPQGVLVLLPSAGNNNRSLCSGGNNGDSLQIGGSGGAGGSTLNVVGGAWTDGNIFSNANNAILRSWGTVYDHCDSQAFVSGLVSSGQIVCETAANCAIGGATQLPDPLYGPFTSKCCQSPDGTAYYSSYSQPAPTDSATPNAVQLEPGQYPAESSSNNGFGAGCWFVEPGIYTWSPLQMQNTGGTVISNELTPPDGAQPATVMPGGFANQEVNDGTPSGNATGVTLTPFDWGLPLGQGQTCRGEILSYPGPAASGTQTGTYYFRVTSLREERINGTNYWRESYLSNPQLANSSQNGSTLYAGCVKAVVSSSSQSVELGISNVPGMGDRSEVDAADTNVASEYHVYAAYNSSLTTNSATDTAECANGPFGYVAKATFSNATCVADPVSGTCGQNQDALGPAKNVTGCPYLPGQGGTPSTAPAPNVNTDRPSDYPTHGVQCSLGYIGSTVMSGGALPGNGYLGTGWGVAAGTYCNPGSPTPGCEPPYLNSPASPGFAPDTANEDECVDVDGNFCDQTPLPASGGVTPGGAMFYFPNQTAPCIKQTNAGAPFVFGALQWQSVVLYAQHNSPSGPANCGTPGSGGGASINGGGGGQFIGQAYFPGPYPATGSRYAPATDPGTLLKVAGGGRPIDGGIIVWQAQLVGGSVSTLTGSFPLTLQITPAHLVICTNGGAAGAAMTATTNPYCPPP